MEINQFPVADKEMAPAISEVTRGRWRLTLPMETMEKKRWIYRKKKVESGEKKGIRMDLAKISITFFVSRSHRSSITYGGII